MTATLALARLFSAAGYRVFVVDSFKNFICSYSRATVKGFVVPSPRYDTSNYIKALQSIIQKEKIGLLIPTSEEIFYLSSYLEELEPLCTVFAASLPNLRQLYNKWTFIQTAKTLGLLVPKTWLIKSRQDLASCLRMATPSQLILKPVYSRLGRNIHLFNQPVERLPKLEIEEKQPWVLQEFIPGQEYTTYSVAQQGELKAHVTHLRSSSLSPVDSWSELVAVKETKILNWVVDFVKAKQFTGQIAFNFIVDEYDDIYPVGCNLQLTKAIHLFHHQDGLTEAFLNTDEDVIQPQKQLKITSSLATIHKGLFPKIIPQKLKQGGQTLTQTQDEVFRLSDPLPAYVFFKGYLNSNDTEFFAQDLEWDGEEITKKN